MTYSMSASMAQGLTSLLTINKNLSDLQLQATTGRKINGPSDGLASYLTASNFTDRSKRLSTVNDGISTALTSIKAAKSGLDSISKLLQDTRATLKAASETQAKQAASGAQFVNDTDPNNTQINMDFRTTGLSGSQAKITNDSRFTQFDTNHHDGFITLGGQKLAQGTQLTFGAGNAVVKIEIGFSNATELPVTSETEGRITVYSVGQLLDTLRTKLGLVINQTGTQNNGAQYKVTYNGAGYDKNGSEINADNPKGISVQLDKIAEYSTGSGSGTTTNKNDILVNKLFTAVRPANTNPSSTYVEDKTKFSDSSTSTASASGVGTKVTITGTQHNYSSAVEAKDADVSRANAAKSYLQAMRTLNQYARDAVTSGVNLLMGDLLKVSLNEKGDSQNAQLLQAGTNAPLTITSVGLGLTDEFGNCLDTSGNFANNYNGLSNSGPGLMNAIDNIDDAFSNVKLAQNQIATFDALISDRKEFNSGLISMLNQTANDLTAADMTEVSTQMAALQVQQSFAQTMLSSTKQADQSIIQLLR